jgi:hypothetical protein
MRNLPDGWFPVSESEAGLFATELKKEMSPAHPLNDVAAVCLARRKDRDDYLFQVPLIDKTHVVVHLTWSKENSADFPWTTFFRNEDDFIQNWRRIFD